jgi:hypothetical protein
MYLRSCTNVNKPFTGGRDTPQENSFFVEQAPKPVLKNAARYKMYWSYEGNRRIGGFICGMKQKIGRCERLILEKKVNRFSIFDSNYQSIQNPKSKIQNYLLDTGPVEKFLNCFIF